MFIFFLGRRHPFIKKFFGQSIIQNYKILFFFVNVLRLHGFYKQVWVIIIVLVVYAININEQVLRLYTCSKVQLRLHIRGTLLLLISNLNFWTNLSHRFEFDFFFVEVWIGQRNSHGVSDFHAINIIWNQKYRTTCPI